MNAIFPVQEATSELTAGGPSHLAFFELLVTDKPAPVHRCKNRALGESRVLGEAAGGQETGPLSKATQRKPSLIWKQA